MPRAARSPERSKAAAPKPNNSSTSLSLFSSRTPLNFFAAFFTCLNLPVVVSRFVQLVSHRFVFTLRALFDSAPAGVVAGRPLRAASSGRHRILEISARFPHQRVPLIMGDVRAVREIDAIHKGVEPLYESSDAPLFARRGLFR